MRTEKEIDGKLDLIDETGRSKCPGMSFEQGIGEALRWVLGDNECLADFKEKRKGKAK